MIYHHVHLRRGLPAAPLSPMCVQHPPGEVRGAADPCGAKGGRGKQISGPDVRHHSTRDIAPAHQNEPLSHGGASLRRGGVGLPATTRRSPDLAGPEDPRELPASPVHHSIKSPAGAGLVRLSRMRDLPLTSEPAEDHGRYPKGFRHRRQATDETSSREVGCCVEYPTGAEWAVWCIRSRTQP